MSDPDDIEFSWHDFHQAVERNISVEEIIQAGANGAIVGG